MAGKKLPARTVPTVPALSAEAMRFIAGDEPTTAEPKRLGSQDPKRSGAKTAPARGEVKAAPARSQVKATPARSQVKAAPARGEDKAAPARGTIERADGRMVRRIPIYFSIDTATLLRLHCARVDVEMSAYVDALVEKDLSHAGGSRAARGAEASHGEPTADPKLLGYQGPKRSSAQSTPVRGVIERADGRQLRKIQIYFNVDTATLLRLHCARVDVEMSAYVDALVEKDLSHERS